MSGSDIEGYEDVIDDNEQKLSLVYLNVRAETSKVNSTRKVISRGGKFFQRLQKRTKPNKSDYVFPEIGGNKMLSKQKWYMHWKNLMEGIGINNYQERKLTWYSLRHFGITCRIRAKVPYGEISKIAGTSVTHIETHYAHYDDEMLKSSALKNFSYDKKGIILNNMN